MAYAHEELGIYQGLCLVFRSENFHRLVWLKVKTLFLSTKQIVQKIQRTLRGIIIGRLTVREWFYFYDYGVRVCASGEIQSIKTGKTLKPTSCKNGYLRIAVKNIKTGKRTGTSVHRLVAIAYIPNPENKSDVNHKDGNKINNCVSNLEWSTRRENMIHAQSNGLRDEGFEAMRKTTRNLAIKHLRQSNWTIEDLSHAFSVSSTRVLEILNGNKKRPVCAQ